MLAVYLKIHKEDFDMQHNDPVSSFQHVKDNFIECMDTLVEIGVICRLKSHDGTPYISCRHFAPDTIVYYYRPQRGGLEEAMAEIYPFVAYDVLEAHILNKFPETRGNFEVSYVRYDERIQWDTYMLTNTEVGGVLGFVNGDPNRMSTLFPNCSGDWI